MTGKTFSETTCVPGTVLSRKSVTMRLTAAAVVNTLLAMSLNPWLPVLTGPCPFAAVYLVK